VNVAVGIATPTAQALANAIKDIPVIYAAVTDPVAAGLVKSYDKGEPNVTGTSDLPPVEAQIDTLLALAPNTKRIGHVYNAGEANSVRTAKVAADYCAQKGVAFVPAVVANSAEVTRPSPPWSAGLTASTSPPTTRSSPPSPRSRTSASGRSCPW
jgi:putative ABC transport system substrate-binding protein